MIQNTVSALPGALRTFGRDLTVLRAAKFASGISPRLTSTDHVEHSERHVGLSRQQLVDELKQANYTKPQVLSLLSGHFTPQAVRGSSLVQEQINQVVSEFSERVEAA